MAKKEIGNAKEAFVPMLLGDADIDERYEGKLSLSFIYKKIKQELASDIFRITRNLCFCLHNKREKILKTSADNLYFDPLHPDLGSTQWKRDILVTEWMIR